MTWLRRLLRVFLWSFAVLTGVLALGYLALVLVNLNDQPPSARALAWNRYFETRAPLADQDNGFVYLLGFGVPQGADPLAEGRQQMAFIRRMDADPDFAPGDFSSAPSLTLSAHRDADVQDLASACHLPGNDCQLALARGLGPMRRWVADEKWLLERYLVLLSKPGWQEPVPMELLAPWPPYTDLGEAQKVLLAQALLLADDGDVAAARALLEKDAQFWRGLLARSEYLIVRMIATRAVARHLLWTGLISRRLAPAQMADVVAAQWQQPISREELSLERVLRGEWAFAARFIANIDRNSPRTRAPEEGYVDAWADIVFSALGRPLLQPQDASNDRAEMLGELSAALDRIRFEKVGEDYARARAVEERSVQAHRRWHPYNLANNIAMSFTGPVYYEYWARTADLEGVRRALLLTIELRRHGVPAREVGAALQRATLRNPYYNLPFAWDDAAGGIRFTGMTEGERGEFLFVY